MHQCSVHKKLKIIPADLSDYKRLAACHYRDRQPASVKAVYALLPRVPIDSQGRKAVGTIVYASPKPCTELRNLATGNIFAGLDRQTQLTLLNRNVRCISRVIIEPRFRGIGLATRLVRETMPMLNVPIIEALGIMPQVNPFLERAGMRAFEPCLAAGHVALLEAFSTVGIEEQDLIDPRAVQERLEALSPAATDFIEAHLQRFLKNQGRRRIMPPGLDRTRFVLGKLTHRPAYYIWFHPTLEVRIP